MPSKSVGFSKRGSDTSNLSEYLLADDDIDLTDLLPLEMIVSPEDLKYEEQIGAGVQGAVFRGKLLAAEAPPWRSNRSARWT